MKYQDYYKTLGVERDADANAIKRAYRVLARKYHPDVSKERDAEARFKEVGEAYEVLKDPEKRAAYDQLGSNWKAGQEFNPPPGWEGRFNVGGGGRASFDVSDFFEGLFGGGRPHTARRRRGRDERVELGVSLEEAYSGAERNVQLQRAGANGRPILQTLKVKIPAGISHGKQIRLAGQGQHSPSGGERGDLFLQVSLTPHEYFTVDGNDINLNLPITPWEAALGATVEVPTLGGKVELRVPPGSQSGRKLRLKGRGLGGKQAGDQYVVLQIMTPLADSAAAKDFYDRMAEEMPFDPRADLARAPG